MHETNNILIYFTLSILITQKCTSLCLFQRLTLMALFNLCSTEESKHQKAITVFPSNDGFSGIITRKILYLSDFPVLFFLFFAIFDTKNRNKIRKEHNIILLGPT